MTDNEIIKALECLAYWGECKLSSQCPYYMDNDIIGGCDNVMIAKEALDLINSQQAEIERLKDENKSIRYCYEQAKSYNDTLAESCEKNCKKFNMTTRAEAIKEFAERLKEKAFKPLGTWFTEKVVTEQRIDTLVKEMTEI